MKIIYRPEIDGLRAIAVGSVILYHAQLGIDFFGRQPFQGGFIGVDIFFVISGYLITSIIFKELVTTGSFSFKNFYERRIRRILPVLLVVMLVSLPFAWIYLMPSGFIDFSKSILFSLGFSSNFYFHYTGLAYGNVEGFFKPFLHTWSLSVEEQYYILFPIVLLITFKYFRKYLIHILIISICISLGLADWGSRNHPSFNFYILPTRIWELLAGSILAYFEITNGHRSKNKILNFILPSIGLLLIGYSVLFFNDAMFHPSFYTLSPIVGVCLIIWFSNKDELITKILSTKLFVGIGLISYSLYLWHYPIFAFVKINLLVSGNIIYKLLLIPIIITLSIISYYFVEKPFRNKTINFKKTILILSTLILALIIFNSKVIQNNGYKNRIDNLKNINPNYNPDNFFLGQTRMKKTKASLKKFDSKDFNIVIAGDSHGEDLFNALSLNRELFNSVNFFFIGNTFVENFYKNQELLRNSDILIFSYRWDDINFKLLKDKFKEINSLNKNIVITSRTNEYRVPSKLYTLLDHKIIFEKKEFDYYGLKNLYFENREIKSESDINQKLKKFAYENKLKYLNKEDYMCEISREQCDYLDLDGHKIFHDYGHYTEYGAKYFGEKIYRMNWLQLK